MRSTRPWLARRGSPPSVARVSPRNLAPSPFKLQPLVFSPCAAAGPRPCFLPIQTKPPELERPEGSEKDAASSRCRIGAATTSNAAGEAAEDAATTCTRRLTQTRAADWRDAEQLIASFGLVQRISRRTLTSTTASTTPEIWSKQLDEDITPMVMQEPITRARAKQLNQRVTSFLGARNSTYKDGIEERTTKALETSTDQEEDQRGIQVKMEAKFYSETTFSAFRTSLH
ncbi:hypothetical protein U9M48_012534 [Paspalum notatum var. saurae]|uniref:Uncharacterized protein n=1 Tax=Paspalum notatum var. saurae TaxID=547442 RepID=A0AAQ3SXS9_PASNO